MTATVPTGTALPTSDVDPFSHEVLEDPLPMHAELREAGPVVHLSRYDVYAFARYARVVGERLGGLWGTLAILRLVPRVVGDWLYDRIARNRYRLFGRNDSCMIPPPQWRDRFIQ